MEEVQINIRCSKAVSERLKAITKAERIKSGDLLEKLLNCYQDSINLAEAVSNDWHSAVAELSSRLLALESRFEGIGAVEIVSQPQVEDVPVVADLVACEPVKNAGAETGVVKAGKRQAVSDAELDALVKRLAAKEEGGFLGIRLTVAALREAGFQANQDRVGESLARLKGA